MRKQLEMKLDGCTDMITELLGAALTPPSATETSLQHARHIKTILVRVCSCACCRLISFVDGGVRTAPSRRLPASIPSPP